MEEGKRRDDGPIFPTHGRGHLLGEIRTSVGSGADDRADDAGDPEHQRDDERSEPRHGSAERHDPRGG
jgi:hypothetical protein